VWKGAQGWLAGIAMLAGVVSGCATTPQPIHGGERDDHSRLVCGGVQPPPTTESLSADIVAKVRASCDAAATAGQRHGEVRLTVRRRADDRARAETEQTASLIDEDRLCALGVAQQVLEDLWQRWHGDLFLFLGKDEVTFHVALGTAPPSIGSAADRS